VDNPPMDNVMPSFDGMEDPKVLEDYRQIELADGGVVEREGFNKGTKIQNKQALVDKTNFIIDRNNKLGIATQTSQLSKDTGLHHSKIKRLMFEEKIIRPSTRDELVNTYIKKQLKNNAPLELFTKENIAKHINHSITEGSQSGISPKSIASAVKKQFPELFNNLYAKHTGAFFNDAKNPDLLNITVNDFIKDPEATSRARVEKRKGKDTLKNQLRLLKGKLQLGPRDFAVSQSQDTFITNINNAIKKNPNLVLDNPKLIELASMKFDNNPESPTYGKPTFGVRDKEKILSDIKTGFFSNEHISPKSLEKMNTEFPTNKILVPKQTNTSFIRSAQAYLRGNPNDSNALKQLEEITNKFNFNINTENGKIGPKQGATVEGNKLLSYKNQLDTLGFNSPDVRFDAVENISKEELIQRKLPMKSKIETIIKNIGCPTGSLNAAEGANCFVKGQEKIKVGKLNNNDFNILQKALKSSSAQTAIKYGGKALKGLGAVLAPIVLYDTYDQYKKGKPLAEILEYGLIGTDFSRDARKIANYTPEEREAVQQAQQYERNEEDISGLSSDFDTPTNLSADEISELSVSGSKRVDDLLLAQDEAKEKQRVYTGAPEIEDYGERVGLKLGTPKKLYDLGKKILKNKEPENPDRRDFLKGAGALGLAVAAFGTGALKLAKALKTKAALKVLAEPAVGQPAWFAPLVDKILLKGIRLEKDGKKLNKYVLEEDGKTITLETANSPKNPININVKGGGAYDDPFDIQYYQTIDKTTGKTKTSFEVLESRPYRFGPDADEVELSEELFEGADLLELPKGGSGILSDMEGLEKIATGKIKNTKLANTRMKVKDELNHPDNYKSSYNPGEEDRMTRSSGPDGGDYYEEIKGKDYYSAKLEDRIMTKNDLDPDIDYD